MPVAYGLGGARDEQVAIPRDTKHGEIALEAATLVEHGGVHDAARHHVDIVGTQSLQETLRIPAIDQQLCEGGLIEQRDAFASRARLARLGIEPGGPAEFQRRGQRITVFGEPRGPLPAHAGAELGAGLGETIVQRTLAQPARRVRLSSRVGDGVVQGERLRNARAKKSLIGVEGREAADVHRPQIARRCALDDPLRQRPARAAAAGDTHRVHAAAHVEARELRRFAEQESAVGREALGTVDEHLHLGVLQRRYAMHGVHHHRLEVFPVLVEELEGEVPWQILQRQRTRVRLEAAREDAVDLVANIEIAVVIAERRKMASDSLHRFGEQIEVLAREERHRHAGHGRHLSAPEAGAVDDDLAGDVATRGIDAAHPVVSNPESGHRGVLEDARTVRLRALDQGRAQIARVHTAVVRRVHGADDVVAAHHRPQLGGLRRRELVGLDTEDFRERGLSANVSEALGVGGDAEAAGPDPAGRLTGLLLERRVKLGAVAYQLGEIVGRAQLPHLGRRMPGGAAGELLSLEQDGLAHTQLRQVIERAAAHDAATDDDGPGV